MKITLYHIADKIGFHPIHLAKAVLEGELTGEVPNGNAQSKDAWVDLLSLRNYIDWLHEQGRLEPVRYLKAIRHIDLVRSANNP